MAYRSPQQSGESTDVRPLNPTELTGAITDCAGDAGALLDREFGGPCGRDHLNVRGNRRGVGARVTFPAAAAAVAWPAWRFA